MEYEAFIDGHKCLYQSGRRQGDTVETHRHHHLRRRRRLIDASEPFTSTHRAVDAAERRQRFTGYAVSQPPPYPPPYAQGAQGTRGAQVMAMGVPHPMQQPAFMGTPYATQQQYARPVTAQTQHGATYYPSM
jgi:hypothetical protein